MKRLFGVGACCFLLLQSHSEAASVDRRATEEPRRAQWEYAVWKDEITDAPNVVLSRKSESGKEVIRIMCSDTLAIRIFSPEVRPSRDAVNVSYRFGRDPAVEDALWFGTAGVTAVLGVHEFLRQMLKSERLVVRAWSARMDVITMRFDLSGLGKAIGMLRRQCPDVSASPLSARDLPVEAMCRLTSPLGEGGRTEMFRCIFRQEQARQWLASNATDQDALDRCKDSLSKDAWYVAAMACVEKRVAPPH